MCRHISRGQKKFDTFRQVLPSSCHTPHPSLPSPTCPLHLFTSPARALKPSEFAAPGWMLSKDLASCHITKCFHSPCLSPAPHPTPSHLSSTENHLPFSQRACFMLAFAQAAPPSWALFPHRRPPTCLPSLCSGFLSLMVTFLTPSTQYTHSCVPLWALLSLSPSSASRGAMHGPRSVLSE